MPELTEDYLMKHIYLSIINTTAKGNYKYVKKIKEGLINEEIVRRYPGFDNVGNYVIDKGKGSGPKSHDYGKVVADELGDLYAKMSGGADDRGIKLSFVRDKTR